MKKKVILSIFSCFLSWYSHADPYIKQLLTQRSSDAESIAFLQSFIRPNDLVFDVGANIGKKAELYLACGARVICFEPQPECLAILYHKFKTNKVVIEKRALAEKEGFLDLLQCSQANTISTFCKDWTEYGRFAQNYKWDNKITVPVVTLDSMIDKYGLPRFCKIDVENFEYDVLKGLTQPIDYISFEFTHEYFDKAQQCVGYLKNLGYLEFNVALGEKSLFIFQRWLCAEEFLKVLGKVAEDKEVWGDIYARFSR